MRRASTAERSVGGVERARGLESEGRRVGKREERAGREPEEREEGCSSSGLVEEVSDSDSETCYWHSSGGQRNRGELFNADELNLLQRTTVI